MKRSIFILLAAFGINVLVAQTTPAQNSTEPVNTPATVSAKFKKDYPNISAYWQMEGDNYSAKYRDKLTNLDRIIVYDRFGNLVHSDYELDYASYPKAISDYFATSYPKEQYTVWSSEDESGYTSYFSRRSSNLSNVIWFDKDGNFSATKPVGTHKISSHKK